MALPRKRRFIARGSAARWSMAGTRPNCPRKREAAPANPSSDPEGFGPKASVSTSARQPKLWIGRRSIGRRLHLSLALLGFLGARTGGAEVLRPIVRVTFWGALAMALTAGIGRVVGTVL